MLSDEQKLRLCFNLVFLASLMLHESPAGCMALYASAACGAGRRDVVRQHQGLLPGVAGPARYGFTVTGFARRVRAAQP